MKLLLINKNPVVSRMMRIGVAKAGFEMEEAKDLAEASGRYDLILVDDELAPENLAEALREEGVEWGRLGILAPAGAEREDADFVLTKPFLPTDLRETLAAQKELLRFEGPDSPFVREPLPQSGVLKKEEIDEVMSLLGEDESPPPPAKKEPEPWSEEERGVGQLAVLRELTTALERLAPEDLRKVLAGMQLDITIKISYPDGKDV